MKSAPVVSLAVLLLSGSALIAAEPSDLTHKFPKAGKRLLREVMETFVGFNMPQGGGVKSSVKVDRTFEESVKSVKGKEAQTAVMAAKLTIVRFSMSIPEKGSIDFDSESPQAKQEASLDPVAAGLWGLKGRKFQYAVDGSGKPPKVTGMSAAAQALFARLKAKEAISQGAAKMCLALFSDGGFEDALAEYYLPLPGSKALPGDKWKGTMSNNLYPLGVLVCSVEYKFEKAEGGKAYVSIAGKADKIDTSTAGLDLPQKDDPTMGMLPTILKNLVIESSSVTGEMVFDLAKGAVLKSSNSVELKCKTEFSPFGNPIVVPFEARKSRTVEMTEAAEEEGRKDK